MLEYVEHGVRLGLRVVEELHRKFHRRHRHAGGVQHVDPFGARFTAQPSFGLCHERIVVLAQIAIVDGVETRVGEPERIDEFHP